MAQTYTENFTEIHELAGATVDTFAIGTYSALMANRSMANYQRAVAILMVGDVAQGATVDLALWQATSAAGANAKLIAGKAITTLTDADSNSVVCIEVRTEELDVDGGFAYLVGVITVAGGNVDLGIIGFLGGANYPPVPTTNWTEIVL